jgi:hypothetical protein
MGTSATANADSIRKLIVDTLPPGTGEHSRLFGGDAPLDSLGLVNFLADLEYRLSEEFGCDVVLASELAMSRQRSPFRDVPALTEYVLELMGV